MPTITSSQNGSYSAGSTWVGGVAPVAGVDDFIIVHEVTVDAPVTGHGLVNGGTGRIIIEDTFTLDGNTEIGNGSGNAGAITFGAGSVLNVDSFDLQLCNCYLDSTTVIDNWATIVGTGNITPGSYPANSSATQEINLQYISFQLTGSAVMWNGTLGGLNPVVNVSNCAFIGLTSLYFTMYTCSPDTDISISNCDFRDITGRVGIGGTGSAGTGIAEFVNNTVSNSTDLTDIHIRGRHGILFSNCVFYNTVSGTAGYGGNTGGGYTMDNIFWTLDPDGTKNQVLAIVEQYDAVTMTNQYHYCPYPNPHVFGKSSSGGSGTHLFENSIYEVPYNTDGANIITLETLPTLVQNNILLKSGTLVNNVGENTGGLVQIFNNTVYKTEFDSTVGGVFLAENGEYTGDIDIYNNIQSGSITDDSSIYDNGAGLANQVIRMSDYNNFDDVTTPYVDVVVTSGQSNDTLLDPSFIDPTRDLASWDAVGGSGTGTEAAAIAYLLNKNGYNSTTKTQSDTPSVNDVTDLLAWVKVGFTPTNQLLKGSGYLDSDIGAVPVGESMKFLKLTDGVNEVKLPCEPGIHKVGICYSALDGLMALNLDGVWTADVPYNGSLGASGGIVVGETSRNIKRKMSEYLADQKDYIDSVISVPVATGSYLLDEAGNTLVDGAGSKLTPII